MGGRFVLVDETDRILAAQQADSGSSLHIRPGMHFAWYLR